MNYPTHRRFRASLSNLGLKQIMTPRFLRKIALCSFFLFFSPSPLFELSSGVTRKERSTCCGERGGHCQSEVKLRSQDTVASRCYCCCCCTATQASSLKLTDEKERHKFASFKRNQRGESCDSERISPFLFRRKVRGCAAAYCRSSVDFLGLFFLRGECSRLKFETPSPRRSGALRQVSLVRKHRAAAVSVSLGERRALVRFAWPPTNAPQCPQLFHA